jgi:uncharacterized protein
MEPRRLRRLPRAQVCGIEVPVARGLRARLLGLALLRRGRAGPGLLIPRCSRVHTFGMRFALDLVFLDGEDRTLREIAGVPRSRFVSCRGAAAVLETPAGVYTPACRVLRPETNKEVDMSLIDKLTGRAKKAAGDLTGDGSLRREGTKEEKKGEAKEKLNRAQDTVEDKADEVADLERKT